MGWRSGIVVAGLVLAGCGTLPHNVVPSVKAPLPLAARAAKDGPVITGISCNGHVATHFSCWEGDSLKLAAVVKNPTNAKVGYFWLTDGMGWGPTDQQVLNFSAPWGGRTYFATCHLLDASGQILGSQSVDIYVNGKRKRSLRGPRSSVRVLSLIHI